MLLRHHIMVDTLIALVFMKRRVSPRFHLIELLLVAVCQSSDSWVNVSKWKPKVLHLECFEGNAHTYLPYQP